MEIKNKMMKAAFLAILFWQVGLAENSRADKPHAECDLFVRLLGEVLSGEVSDYLNASPEVRLLIEARVRHVMFNYWVNVKKFGYVKSEMVEVRFGEFVRTVKNNNGFDRAFKNPHFIANADAGAFPRQRFKSHDGKRFEINSPEEFRKVNEEFLRFLEECAGNGNQESTR